LARTYGSTDWSRGNIVRYAAGRVARIYPVYLLSLLAIGPIIAADPTPIKGSQLVTHSLLVQAWFGRIPVNWNIPAWSLSCEIFFYLSFPLAAIAMARAGCKQSLALAAAATCLTRVLWACGVPDELKPVIHLSDFWMGVATARLYDAICDRGWRGAGAWFYLPALGLGALLIARPGLLPAWVDLNTALRPINALLLLGFALGGGAAARALSTRVAVYLGKASYSMYILHIPILWWYLRWARAASASIYLTAVIAVSAVVYRFVEEPANRWLRRRVQVALQT
jgi:peptidoglycan/LPS O-acetylase OafA/YrhL